MTAPKQATVGSSFLESKKEVKTGNEA